ncbi:hypothetical protein [Pseudorhodobacter sp.]|uniref:hypothetical protein n=1 Tax=Pseudorhodobacter sp. TaxID=1934400 RepID=UPI002AFFBABC|nr:hypothetical protein [Pseudorhodobacter sp.]
MSDLRTAIIQAQQTAQMLDRAKAASDRLLMTLEGTVEGALNSPLIADQHRDMHRRGTPSRLNTDPELQAFVLARIEHKTYKEVVSDVAKSFPPERQISISSLQRWWRKRSPQSALTVNY